MKELARKACALLICYVNIHDCDINIAYLEQKEAEFVKAYNEKSDQAFQMRAMHPDAVKELKTYQVGQSTLSPVAQQIHDIETVRVQNWKNVLDIRRKLSFKQGERIKKKGLADSLVITLSQKDTTLPPDVEEVIDEICSENKAATLKTIEATEAADNRMGDYMKTTETIVNSPERCKKIIQVEMDAAAAPRKLNTLQEELENSQTDHRNLVVNQ